MPQAEGSRGQAGVFQKQEGGGQMLVGQRRQDPGHAGPGGLRWESGFILAAVERLKQGTK